MNDVRRKIGSGLAAALLLAAPAAAPAQMTGSRLGGTRVDIPDDITGVDRARYTMLRMGECLVKQDNGRAKRFVSTFPNSKEALKFARGYLYQEDCLSSGEVTMTENHLRAAVYAALYREYYVPAGPGDVAHAPPVDYAQGQPIMELDDIGRQSVAIRQMGDCIVRADPAAADSLIASEIQSEREKAAFQALIAKIPDCITQGVTLKMNTLTLHGIVSESLYRLAEAARNNPTATGQ